MKIELKKVTVENLYETIHEFVQNKEMVVEDYDSMIEVILAMIKGGHCFTMDRDILRDAMESLTYMYAPSDDMNKDRLVQQFADEEGDDDDDESSSEEDGFGNMDLMKMMQMMGGMGVSEGGVPQCQPCETPEELTDDCKKVVTDEEPVEEKAKVVKEESDATEETDEKIAEDALMKKL